MYYTTKLTSYFCIMVTISAFYYYMYHFTQDFPSFKLIGSTLTANYFRFINYTAKVEEHHNFTNKSLPVILRPNGGMGNQLFQYSAAYAVAKNRISDLYICVSEDDFNKTEKTFNAFNSFDRSYSLDIFGVPRDKLLIIPKGQKNCRYSDLAGGNFSVNDISFFHEAEILNDKIPKDKVVQLYGYAESEIFFKDYKEELKKLLHVEIEPLPSELKDILHRINQSESVAVHVRRGDFIQNSSNNRTIPLNYYSRALKLMASFLKTTNRKIAKEANITFFVFSDDIEGVKKEFRKLFQNESYHMMFLSNKKLSRVIDFYLMAHCKHLVIANSTFSWWAAYLNLRRNKIVIAPLPKYLPWWLQMYHEGQDREIAKKVYMGEWAYPEDWITINPFENEQ